MKKNWKFYSIILIISFIGSGKVFADTRVVNILNSNYFGFEAGSNDWYFWNTTDYWNIVSEKASSGNYSMKFSYPDLSSIDFSVKAQTGSDANEGSKFEVEKGTHEMTVKIWKEPGTTIKSFLLVVKDPWTLYEWKIDTVTAGKWVTLKRDIALSQDVSSTWQLVVDKGETGGGTFYLDDFSILKEVEIQKEIPPISYLRTTENISFSLENDTYYQIKMKVWKEEGTRSNGFYTEIVGSNLVNFWNIDDIDFGKWVELKQNFYCSIETSNNGVEFSIPNASIMGGGNGTFYVDDIEIVKDTVLRASLINNYVSDCILFPNPTNDKLYVQSSEEISSILFRSMDGRKLNNCILNRKDGLLSVSQLSAGFYLAEIHFVGGRSIVKKIIICDN